MSRLYRTIVLFVTAVFIASCGGPGSLPKINIVRHPEPLGSRSLVYTELPTFDPTSTDPFQVDLRSADLTKLDLSKSGGNLLYADFDSKTQWPTSHKMPTDFDWQQIMEIGKDPGLGMRTLHNKGITGKGVGIAIIDQPLLVDHQEYEDRLQLYEEINILPDTKATMHGPAVASIAVGRTVGVAPKADLYYIGAWTGDWGVGPNNFTWNFIYYAQAVHRILEINQGLPKDRKIRVIAMQVGWSPDQGGYDDIMAAVNDAKAEGIFVISTSSLLESYGFYFQGLGRKPMANPNEFKSYEPGLWWQQRFFDHGLPPEVLLVPMDSRTTANPTGAKDYVFYRENGLSWAVPYLAGMYALTVQVKPDITPEEFWSTALETGKTIQIQQDGKEYKFGVILDPQALIEAIKSK